MHCFLFFLVFFFGDLVIPVVNRFRPKPEELVYYLKEKRRDPAFTVPDIKDVNIYKYHPSELPGLFSSYHPSELPGLASIQSDDQVWYFFCTLENKYGKSDRASRTAIGGSWKKTGKDHQVEAKDGNKPIGIKKIFVFYKDRDFRKENRTNWIMHEYSEIQEDHNSNKQVESQQPRNLHLPSSSDHDVADSNLTEVRPLVPALQDELIDCNGVCHKSLSTFQSPIYQMPGSFYSSSYSNDSARWLVQNSFSALQSPIHLPPESSYSGGFSNNLTNGLELDHTSFTSLQCPIHPQPGSSYSSVFSNNSSGFSNDSTNGLNHSSFSSLQSPILPQPGSSHSSCFSNGSNVWTPQSASEQEDDIANSRLMELQPNQHTSYVTTNDFPESESQLLPPKRHKSSNGEDLVAKNISSEPLPEAEDIFSGLEPLVSGKWDAIDRLQSPNSSVFDDDSIVRNTLLGSELEDDFLNMEWVFQDDVFSEETGHSLPPGVNSSKTVT